MLETSNHVRERKYFVGDEVRTLQLRTKFSRIEFENSLLQGNVKIEVAKSGTDIDGNYNVIKHTLDVKFFVGLKIKSHLIVVSDIDSLARTLSKVFNSVLYNGKRQLPRVRLIDSQIIKFCADNKHTLKGEISSSSIRGVSTIGLWGTNVEKSGEMELIRRYLTEQRAIKLLLHDNGWTVWINKKTGSMSCLGAHSHSQFVEFIQDKILTLGV